MHDPRLMAGITDLVRRSGKLPTTAYVGPLSRFVEDLGIDSLDLVAFYLGVQDLTGVVIEDEDIQSLRCPSDVCAYVAARRSVVAA